MMILLLILGYIVVALIVSIIAVKVSDDLDGEDAILIGLIWFVAIPVLIVAFGVAFIYDSWVDFLERLR